MTPGRINQIAAFSSTRALPARASGLTPRLCYSGPPGPVPLEASALFLLSVCSSRLASRPTSTRPSCARVTGPVVFRAFPRASTSRFAILSTPLALLARRTPEQTSLSRVFLLGEASWSSPAAARPAAAAPPEFLHAETEGAPACLLRPLTITEPVPVQTSPLSRLCPSSTDAPV